MKPIQTLADFVESAGARLRVFDMGRRISKLSSRQFEDFEAARHPYPYPFQRQARLAMLVWNPKQPQQHAIWFLKLPLDEQGLLQQAARDEILARLLQQVGENLLDPNENSNPLKDNPFAFTPDQERMAAFHARATLTLQQPASSYYAGCRDYLRGREPLAHWEQLGWQGIADFCARLEEGDNEALLTRQLPHLPGAPLEAFCVNLESVPLSHTLTQALCLRLEEELAQTTMPNRIGALLRSLALAQPAARRNQAIESALAASCGSDIEVLAAIAGRCWEALEDQDLCMQFLEKLASCQAGQGAFNALVADLLFMPGMRPTIMGCLRNPNRSAQLSQAIGALFNAGAP